jgi:hypothetical protein
MHKIAFMISSVFPKGCLGVPTTTTAPAAGPRESELIGQLRAQVRCDGLDHLQLQPAAVLGPVLKVLLTSPARGTSQLRMDGTPPTRRRIIWSRVPHAVVAHVRENWGRRFLWKLHTGGRDCRDAPNRSVGCSMLPKATPRPVGTINVNASQSKKKKKKKKK